MFRELKNVIYDKNFKMTILEDKISIKPFKDILIFEENELLIKTENKIIKIKGENLTINKLENYEILILGNIITVEFRWYND